MDNKTIIHIGGGALQIPAIKAIKQLGLKVIVTDCNKSSPGAKLADQFWNIDGSKINQVIQRCKQQDTSSVIGIWSNNDYGVETVAAVNESLGLQGVTIKAAKQALNKELSKSIWQENHIRTPAGKKVATLSDALKFGTDVGYPIIVKPSNSSGSRGVCSVSIDGGLNQAFNEALAFSNTVIVEELIEGDHVDVNGLFLNGNFHRMGLIDRHFCEPPYTYSLWGCTPSSLQAWEDEIYSAVEQAARSLGITSGPVKADCIWSNGEAVILEISPRFHGEVITAFTIPHAYGIRPAELWFQHLMGISELDTALQSNKTAGWRGLYAYKKGSLSAVEGVDAALKQSGISSVYLRKGNGDVVRKPKDNTDLCGFVWGQGCSIREVESRLRLANQTIQFNVKAQENKPNE